jgi:hypothetical protein
MDFIGVQKLHVNTHVAKGKFLLSLLRSMRTYYYVGFYGFARFQCH